MLLGVACVGFLVGLYSLPVVVFFLTLLLHDAGGRRSARLGQYGVSSGLCFDGRRAAGQYLSGAAGCRAGARHLRGPARRSSWSGNA